MGTVSSASENDAPSVILLEFTSFIYLHVSVLKFTQLSGIMSKDDVHYNCE